jgi:hypothetical protein
MPSDRSLTRFPNPGPPLPTLPRKRGRVGRGQSFGTPSFPRCTGVIHRALIVHRGFILPHSRLETRLSDSPRIIAHIRACSLLRSFVVDME